MSTKNSKTLEEKLVKSQRNIEYKTENNLILESGVLTILADAVDCNNYQSVKFGTKIIKIKDENDEKFKVLNVRKMDGKLGNLVDEYLNIDMDHMLNFIGTEGKYQYTLIVLVSIMSIVMSMI